MTFHWKIIKNLAHKFDSAVRFSAHIAVAALGGGDGRFLRGEVGGKPLGNRKMILCQIGANELLSSL